MNKPYSNPCSRCGTERIVLRTWKENVYGSTITNTEKICPNPDCQKEVNKDNKKVREKQALMKLKSEQRATNRKTTREATKQAKLRSHHK